MVAQRGILVLVRGLPGSGKSTYAARFATAHPGSTHYEADQYFVKDGVYTYDPRAIRYAHSWVAAQVEHDMIQAIGSAGPHVVVVSNTFSRQWEMAELMQLAAKYGWAVEVKTLFDAGLTDTQLHERGVHKVPLTTINAMRRRWEPWPDEVRIEGQEAL